jgi:hypothetical protein
VFKWKPRHQEGPLAEFLQSTSIPGILLNFIIYLLSFPSLNHTRAQFREAKLERPIKYKKDCFIGREII